MSGATYVEGTSKALNNHLKRPYDGVCASPSHQASDLGRGDFYPEFPLTQVQMTKITWLWLQFLGVDAQEFSTCHYVLTTGGEEIRVHLMLDSLAVVIHLSLYVKPSAWGF